MYDVQNYLGGANAPLNLILLKKYGIIYIDKEIEGDIDMSAIMGKFQGIKVYKTTLPEYVNMRLYKDEENMYIIDDDMIYKNEIFAKWDGKYVNELDPYERAVYYTIPQVKVENGGTQSANGNDIREYTFDISFSSGKMTVEEKNETKINTEPVEVVKAEDVLAGVYDTDYSDLFTDVDAFLKNALKN